MLSILIPVYNYNVVPLVEALQKNMQGLNIPYEIIVFNDASSSFLNENLVLKEKQNVVYEILEENIGRSKIRNLLAKKAKYEWLLFLDSDVIPTNTTFISDYLPSINTEVKVVYGGILYSEKKPEKEKLLRWIYGKERESLPFNIRSKKPYISFLTLNFLVHKSIFEKVSFNESIPNLRHEDTLFSYNLKQQQIPIFHINNPVYHLGLDTFENAIQKENEALLALKNLLDRNLIAFDYLKISRLFHIIKRCQLVIFIGLIHNRISSLMINNLASSQPSLFIYDLYRLGYLCKLYTKK